MKKIIVLSMLILFISASLFNIIGSGDGYEKREEHEYGEKEGGKQKSKLAGWFSDDESISPVNNGAYKESCAECHFSYQAELLPAKSWERMMTDKELEDHFGEYLTYEPAVKNVLLNYLLSNAADRSSAEISRKIVSSIQTGVSPLKISETGYIVRKHDEIPSKMITGNKDVNTLGNCNACHTTADKGNFDEDNVKIPNYPNYDD